RSQGVAPAEAEQLADRVVAWRTPLRPGLPDDAADPYRDDNRRYGPRHGPFRSIEELRLVIGISDALQKTVAPLVTVYSRTPDVDRQVATAAVLNALVEMGDRLAETQRDARERGQASGVDRAAQMGEAMTIRSQLTDGDTVMVLTAVVRLTGDRRMPVWVLRWQ
ncbi:MAG TPA: hypothetical protein VHA37_07650, partial [Candidatus Saccharimonadales bacterium]|nr:hypothetical protein [Candidatus Saccharimonadales bacterium]